MAPIDEHLERDAFLVMQGRLIELLLRHDISRFDKTFDERLADGLNDPRLQRYRELAVLFFLRDELFNTILPKIKRRLSFVAPRELRTEGLPARGRIDWPRTMTSSMQTLPGEPPLQVQTRQRRRHFATPENMLTVATLLEYQAAAQHILDSEVAHDYAQGLRHPLHEIIDACVRELAFPQFASLIGEATMVVEQRSGQSLAELEVQVVANLLPGRNSAYNDLLIWRKKLASLNLLERQDITAPQLMLGADPDEADFLYQYWLFYEILDLLQRRACLKTWDATEATALFVWGDGDYQRQYTLRHDRTIQHHWQNAPGVRPDLYISHTVRQEVRDGTTLIWHEPGFVLDAKYYKPRDSSRAPASTVKRMIADLRLTGERQGALLFAFQRGTSVPKILSSQPSDPGEDEPDIANAPLVMDKPLYRVTPDGPAAQRSAPDETVAVWRIWPRLGNESAVEQTLLAILDEAHGALCERIEPRCHGVFLDTLSVSERTGLADRYGMALDDKHELLICPKPHIGPWRIDLVSRTRHCCQDARFCHIIGQTQARPPVRPPRSAEDLLQELQHIFEQAGDGELDSEAISTIAQQVEGLTRRFAEIAGAYKRIDVYYQRLRDFGLEVFDRLGPTERESLGLGVFLLEQLDLIGASDYSAPAIHFSSVMEIEVQRRVFACPDLIGDISKPKKQTLGTLPWMRQNQELTEGNWDRLQRYVAAHWNEQIDPDDPTRLVSFDQFVSKALNRISQLRNKAAHTHPVSRKEYGDLQRLMLQAGQLGCGALNALLLAWQ